MGEVIQVNFRSKCRTEYRADRLYFGFIEILERQGLCEDDIQEVLDAIQDPLYYETVDDDIKHIVDVWHNATAGIR